VIVLVNTLTVLPPFVAGLAVFQLPSRSGQPGPPGLLFTPMAMVIAQTLLVLPILVALTRTTVEDRRGE
jgi:tungstate transport system permease protein